MPRKRLETGRHAELIVADRLEAAGWRLLERNARTRYGELDLVAMDGRVLVFIEVKAGREGSAYGPERPVHAVGPRKQRQVRRLAAAYLAERELPRWSAIRFDAVGVLFGRHGRLLDVEHIENAF